MTGGRASPGIGPDPVLARLSALYPPLAALLSAEGRSLPEPMSVAVRHHLTSDNATVPTSYGLLDGIAAQVHVLGNGRRQILRVIVAGEMFGSHGEHGITVPLAIVALTPITFRAIDPLVNATGTLGRAMRQALRQDAAITELLLFNQILRLGRLGGYERVAHLLLELRDRYCFSGLCVGDSYPLVLTQDMIASIVGLTPVHVNRQIRLLKSQEMLGIDDGQATILDYEKLAWTVEYKSLF